MLQCRDARHGARLHVPELHVHLHRLARHRAHRPLRRAGRPRVPRPRAAHRGRRRLAEPPDRRAAAPQAHARVGARVRDRRRLGCRRPPARPVARRRRGRGDLSRPSRCRRASRPTTPRCSSSCAARTTAGRARCSAASTSCSRSAWSRCSTSTARSKRRAASPSRGLPRAVPARTGSATAVQRSRVRPVLGGRAGPRPAAHVPFRYRPRAARRARSRRRGRQLHPRRAARRPDGDAHDGRGRRARPVPRAAARHRRDRRRVARLDHDPGRRDLRRPQRIRAAEAVAEAERADPAPGPRDVHVRPGRDQQPRDHRRRDADVGQRLPAPGRARGPRRRRSRRGSSTVSPTPTCTPSLPATRPRCSASISPYLALS